MECCEQAVRSVFKRLRKDHGFGEFDCAEDIRFKDPGKFDILLAIEELELTWEIMKEQEESTLATSH